MPDEFEQFPVDVEPTADGIQVEIPAEAIDESDCEWAGAIAQPYSNGIHLIGGGP